MILRAVAGLMRRVWAVANDNGNYTGVAVMFGDFNAVAKGDSSAGLMVDLPEDAFSADEDFFQKQNDTKMDVPPVDVVAGIPVDAKLQNTMSPQPEAVNHEDSGVKLQEAFNTALNSVHPLELTQKGKAFSHTGHGAKHADREIGAQQEVIDDLKGAIAEYEDDHPELAEQQAAEAAGPGGGKQEVVAEVTPVIAPQNASVETAGAGSMVTFKQASEYGVSAIDQDAGYTIAAAAPAGHDVMATAPTPIPQDEMMGTVNHIIEPGMEGVKVEFSLDEINEIKACCAQWDQDTQDARDAFESWRKGPIQITDLQDVKELPKQALKVDRDQELQLTSDVPQLREQPVWVANGMKMGA